MSAFCLCFRLDACNVLIVEMEVHYAECEMVLIYKLKLCVADIVFHCCITHFMIEWHVVYQTIVFTNRSNIFRSIENKKTCSFRLVHVTTHIRI